MGRINSIEDIIGQEDLSCVRRRTKETRVQEGINGSEEALGIKERVLRNELCGE
jgi:hypothetical protein